MTHHLARVAGQLCANPRFQSWLGASDADEAAQVLRERCQVASRRELDANPAAAERFHAVRKAFAYGGTP
ncbi:hypothetical protein [Pigmentiphaga sp. CHJ604]|uniref:hypothetical protein n=1 Tax=Pigmentiphaga sp. CHJ604 TaxID=3081984 RepID=UPI0030CB028C